MAADLRTVTNAAAPKASDEHLQQIREQIGSGFTDQLKAGKKRNEMGKDDFMRLMTAQMKYQDPMSPMKNEEMAAQLAQFSSLEQMMNVNGNLEKMTAAQRPQENMMAATLIGKKVVTDLSKFNFDKKTEPTVKFELPANTAETTVAVADEKGEVVREIKLGAMKAGPQTIKWDGKSDKGMDQPVGNYTFHIVAKDTQSRPIEVKTGSSGIVSGVVFEQGKTLLIVDGKKIPMETVNRIEDNSVAAQATQAAPNAEQISAEMPAPGAGIAPAKSLTDKNTGKQNISSVQQAPKNSEKISQPSLQSALDPEIIKSMIAAASKTPAGSAKAGGAVEDVAEQEAPMPLWNPNL